MAQRVVVVLGGASGIGAATARRFAADGDTVVVGDLAGAEVVDVTEEDAVDDLFGRVVAREGRVDVVVNCAGIGALAPIVDLDAAQWRRVLDVNLTGAFLTIKHAARRMGAGGSIVTIASLNARQPGAGMSAYCAAKAGVAMLTEVAALELGQKGIRVNAISPGLVDTPLVAPLLGVPGVRDEYVENTPLGRAGTPDDIAEAVVFLSAPGSWITGEVLNVNGGAHTGRYPDLLGRIAAAGGR